MNIHDRARQMVAQSPRPMELREAYEELGRRAAEKRRRSNYGRTTVSPGAFSTVETPAKYRLPYADS